MEAFLLISGAVVIFFLIWLIIIKEIQISAMHNELSESRKSNNELINANYALTQKQLKSNIKY